MPIPQPQPGEPEEDFTRRCMADDTMRQEYPDLRQRLAVCSAQGKNETDEKQTYGFSTRRQENTEG
jgi:hypothetical protein